MMGINRFKRMMLYLIPLVTLVLIVTSILGFAFSVQAKNEITTLKTRVSNLEAVTAPPKLSVLAEEMGLAISESSNYTISISKLIVEEVGLNTMVRAEVHNKSNQEHTYIINNRVPSHTQEGFKEISLDSPFVVVPLTDKLTIDAGEKKTVVILVSKLDQNLENTEAWVSIQQESGAQIQSELCLRILIKP